MLKDVIKSLIAIKQSEIPFDVIDRDIELPINRKKIITIPGVRRCGKSTLMMIAINNLIESGVSPERILWLGFDDERLVNLSAEDLDTVLVSTTRRSGTKVGLTWSIPSVPRWCSARRVRVSLTPL